MQKNKCIGVDVGYGYTKVVTDSGDGITQVIEPSVVGDYEDRTVEVEGLRLSELNIVEINGQKLLVGGSALKHSSRVFNFREKNWTESVAYRALMKNAISHAQPRSIKLFIISGLPVSYYKSDKGKLSMVLRNIAADAAINITVKVIPQPLGSFFNLLFDDNGEIQDEGLASSRIGILDIGFYTSDLLTIDNLELVEKQIGSFENGVAGTLESLSKDIEKVYDLRPDLHKTEEAIRKGSIRVFGENHDITEMVKHRLLELTTEIEARAKTIWKTAADLDKVFLTGGGATLLESYLDLYKHAVVIDGAQFANARGYYRYAKRISHEE